MKVTRGWDHFEESPLSFESILYKTESNPEDGQRDRIKVRFQLSRIGDPRLRIYTSSNHKVTEGDIIQLDGDEFEVVQEVYNESPHISEYVIEEIKDSV